MTEWLRNGPLHRTRWPEPSPWVRCITDFLGKR